MTTAAQLQTRRRRWWLLLITGLLALVVGGILLWWPAKYRIETYLILVMAIGLRLLVEGALQIIARFLDHAPWGRMLLLRIIGIWLGMGVLSYLVAAGIVGPKLDLLSLGIWGFVNGAALLFIAFRGGGWGRAYLGSSVWSWALCWS